MAWEVAVAGTVCLDEVTTPMGHAADQPGGSALYFALAAARHARVRVLGAVGRDAAALIRGALAVPGVDTSALEVVDLPTRRWHAVHDFERWVTASEHSEEGASAAWHPGLSGAAAAAEVLFLGSMEPRHQRSVLQGARARLVAADSMVVHIATDPEAVTGVVERCDILFLNRSELGELTGQPEERWREAARSLCGRGRLRAVVVKAGPLGAAVVTASRVVSREAHPVDPVVDPTGAGDALAGGFLGACAAAERDDEHIVPEALDAGLRCAADAIAAFGPDALRAVGGRGSARPPAMTG